MAGIDCTDCVNTKSNVVLVGPMGSGKTAVGRQLARHLDMEFVDSDNEIERRTGVDITFIFDKEGERGFRERECAVIADLTSRKKVVLATGGGAVLDPGNRNLLGDSGTVVYLKTSLAHQLERTRHSKNRPLLQNEDPAAVLRRLMEERGPLYDEIADIVVTTGNQRIGAMVREIGARLHEHGFVAPGLANAVPAPAPADGQ
jgi:shikimate kinase